MQLNEIFGFGQQAPVGDWVNSIRHMAGGGTMKGNKYEFAAPRREVITMLDRHFTKTGDESWDAEDGWKMHLVPGKSTIVFTR